MVNINSDAAEADEPSLTYVAALQFRRCQENGFEFGISAELQQLTSVFHQTYIYYNGKPMPESKQTAYYANLSVIGSLFGGYAVRSKKSSIAFGLSVGVCTIPESDYGPYDRRSMFNVKGTGIVTGLYARYNYALTKRIGFDAAVSPCFVYVDASFRTTGSKNNLYGIMLPVTVGLSFRINNPHSGTAFHRVLFSP